MLKSWRVHNTFHMSRLHKYKCIEEFIRELELLPLKWVKREKKNLKSRQLFGIEE